MLVAPVRAATSRGAAVVAANTSETLDERARCYAADGCVLSARPRARRLRGLPLPQHLRAARSADEFLSVRSGDLHTRGLVFDRHWWQVQRYTITPHLQPPHINVLASLMGSSVPIPNDWMDLPFGGASAPYDKAYALSVPNINDVLRSAGQHNASTIVDLSGDVIWVASEDNTQHTATHSNITTLSNTATEQHNNTATQLHSNTTHVLVCEKTWMRHSFFCCAYFHFPALSFLCSLLMVLRHAW